MLEFDYFLPVNLKFGCGKVSILGKEAAAYGKKALIVTGKSSTKKTGLLDKAVALLHDAGVETVVFDEVEPNPLTTTAYRGVEMAEKNKCDMVVALGGGSIIDCAKCISFMVLNKGDIFEYIFGKKTGTESLPLLVVVTTCGTGTEGNGNAVLTNVDNYDKKSLKGTCIIPKVSIIDPECMATMPKKVYASVAFDALCHCMEAYVSKTAQPMVEMQALYGIKLLGENLVKVYKNLEDMEAWAAVSFASTLGGMAINTAGVCTPHALEHPASGLRNIVHGRGLSALVPIIYDKTVSYAKEKYSEISKLLGGTDYADLPDVLRNMLKEIELATTLSAEGVLEEDIPWMASNSIKVMGGCIENFPRVFSQSEIEEIYREAM